MKQSPRSSALVVTAGQRAQRRRSVRHHAQLNDLASRGNVDRKKGDFG
jgi:hypothetical protein